MVVFEKIHNPLIIKSEFSSYFLQIRIVSLMIKF